MKRLRILLLLFVTLVVSGCQSKVTSTNPAISDSNVYKADMSNYNGYDANIQPFIGITLDGLKELFNNKGSGIIMISYDTCPYCNQVYSLIAKLADDNDVTIYYLDCHPANEDLAFTQEDIDDLTSLLSGYLLTDDQGNEGIYTPHLFALKDGQIIENQVGTDDYSKTNTANLTEKYTTIITALK